MAYSPILSPAQKALAINLNDKIYGSFAEIGAGQEVVRHFFRAGGAAGTLARSISAYDMAMSDSIYGKSEDGRYVSRKRLRRMLDIEFEMALDRLESKRPEGTCFFAFANTVTAKAFKGNRPCHGWVGMRFQHACKAKSSTVILHIRMYDTQNITQQEAVGILGVNLVHACYNYTDNHVRFVKALMENLNRDSIEIDMIEVTGDAFGGIDSRVLSLELVKQGITDVVMFDEDGNILQPSDVLYKKHILVLRGSFRPPTNVHFDMISCAQRKLIEYVGQNEKENVIVLPEISMNNLRGGGEIDTHDFLDRVDLLSALKSRVLITNFDNYHSLNSYLMKQSAKEIGFVIGTHTVKEILDESRFANYETGILGALGAMFGNYTRAYVYPNINEATNELLTASNLEVPPAIRPLKQYLLDNRYLQDITDFNKDNLKVWSSRVLKMIQDKTPGWESSVPASVAETVKNKNLFSAH